MATQLLQDCWTHPDDFAKRWRGGAGAAQLAPLMASAALGAGLYSGGSRLIEGAGSAAAGAAAGAAAPLVLWAACVPTLFIVGSHLGSGLKLREVMLVSLEAVSFGGLALACGQPQVLFLQVALPGDWLAALELPYAEVFHQAARFAVLLLAGLCAGDVLSRALGAVEERWSVRALWKGLAGLCWIQLGAALGAL
jgi:hypothetical protein